MTRILFLVPHLPYPPHQGGALRNFGLIEELAKRGHRLGLLTFAEPDQPSLEDTPLAKLCSPAQVIPAPLRTGRDRLRDLLDGHADMARRFWSRDFREALIHILRKHSFDVIHLDLEMTHYLPTLHQYAPASRLIYDSLNAEYDLQRRIALRDLRLPTRWPLAIYSLIQAARLTRLETDLCQVVSHVTACSEADAEKLRQLKHTTPITVVPNAISVADYQGAIQPADIPHPAIVFTGKMDFRPNVDAALWFADDILPIIRRSIPDATLIVVGQKPHARLDRLRHQPGVILTGFVPDVKPYLAAADVYVAPLRMGSGTRFKLLEAMAMQKAIVSTRLGAEGLAVTSGREMLLADSAGEFAAAVVTLLGDTQRRWALGEAAAKLVSANYDWEAIIPRIEKVYAGG
jgi:sugar transferase (PEP-CTERM/EpsH1 system associated)